MYKLLKADKDTYIQNKWINSSRSVDANVGLASSIDLYYLYGETTIVGLTGSAYTASLQEISRGLIHFDLSELRALTSSFLNIADSSFKTYLSLKNVYGGQTTPSNFSLSINPLAKTFDEGVGFDVVGYRDTDSSNWITSSKIGNSAVTWSVSGAGAAGYVGDSNIDYYLNYQTTASFTKGDENLYIDITPIVSATLANTLPDYGMRIAFTSSIETGTDTYFVKRFGTRHLTKETLRPRLVCLFDNSVSDNQLDCTFNLQNNIGIYNRTVNSVANFTSGSTTITGSNSLVLTLNTSRYVSYATTSFSYTHSRSITYTTRSLIYYSQSFSGSQLNIGNIAQTGQYTASVNIDYYSTDFVAFHSNSLTEIEFIPVWKSVDQTVTYATGSTLLFKRQNGSPRNSSDNGYVLSITNFRQEYKSTQTPRFRVFLFDNSMNIDRASRLPLEHKSSISNSLYFRLVDAYTKDEIIPFTTESNATKLSSDGDGMYFDLDLSDLVTNKVYEFEFMIFDTNHTAYFKNLGYRFKIV
jgi:hypothetical protein